jgi:hypothetical protein
LLKARNRKLSMILVLAMLMTMFAGLGTASASTPYSAAAVPTFGTGSINNQALGIIQVEVDNGLAVQKYDALTVSLPSGVTLADDTANIVNTDEFTRDTANFAVQIHVPEKYPGTDTGNSVKNTITSVKPGSTLKSIEIAFGSNGVAGKGVFYIYINNANLSGVDADLVATLMSNGNALPMGTVTIGKVVSGSGTTATVKSVKTIGTSGGEIDTITIVETKPNNWGVGDSIKFKLPAGFGWDTSPGAIAASGQWAFANKLGSTATPGHFSLNISEADRLLTVTLNSAAFSGKTAGTARIDIGAATTSFLPSIKVTDDTVAKMGEVTMAISGNNVTDQDLVIAKMADYDVEVVEDTVADVIAGWDSDIDAKFKVVESMPGALIAGRNITLTLPEGAKWNTNYQTVPSGTTFDRTKYWPDLGVGADKPVTTELYKGSGDYFTDASTPTVSNNGRTLRFKIDKNSTSARTIIFKKFQVSLRADFTGDLDIEVAGNAGVKGTVKIAEVVAPLSIESDGKAKIVIGAQGQAVGDITLKEAAKEAIDTSQGNYVYLRLPEGASWTVKPTVEVTEGDVALDSVNTDGRLLKLNFKSASTKASTIKISNIQVTTTRIIPEGDFKLAIATNSNALTNNSAEDFFNISSVASVVIGQCVTPAGDSSKTGEFKIGSNIYYVNGVAKVMDVAPYIKNDRTYTPMRYVADVIGAEVVWDDSARTVTLTKDETTVVFTVGSTAYTVNGESMTADVAPEIVNDRTMLPARFVAEAFGSIVGWDAGTQTVLIQ